MHRSIIEQIAADPNIHPEFKRGCAMLVESAAPAACAHEYVEAQNYGQERDNVECRKCGQLWLRHDRAARAEGR